MSEKKKVVPQRLGENKIEHVYKIGENLRFVFPEEIVAGSHIKIFLSDSQGRMISPNNIKFEFVGDSGGCEISKALTATKSGHELSILLIAGSTPGLRKLRITIKIGKKSISHTISFKVIGHKSNAVEGAGLNIIGVDPAHKPMISLFNDISTQSEDDPSDGGAKVLNFGIIQLGWDYAGYDHPFDSYKDWTGLFGGEGPSNSGGRNVRTFYEEMQEPFTIRCRKIGTYIMNENWNDCFWQGASYHWFPNGNLLNAIFEKARVDIENLGPDFVKTLHGLFIVVMPSPHNQAVWPCCFGPRNVTISAGRRGQEISKFIYGIFVSEDIDEPGTATYVPNYDLVERTAHEIGHTLGMQDLRMTTSPGGGSAPLNPVNDWDLMCDEKLLPQIALPNRVSHALIPDNRLYGHSIYHPDETIIQPATQASGRPTAQFQEKRGLIFEQEEGEQTQISLADLEPLETVLNINPNGLELVITEGWSLFFEYRSKQDLQISDQYVERIAHVPPGISHALIGTQSKLWGKYAPYRQVEMLSHIHNGLPFHTAINRGESFSDIIVKTQENSAIGDILRDRRLGISVKFIGVENECARIAITKTEPPEQRPDPCIRPWKGYDEWISPDIEAQNDRNEAGIAPGLKNVIKVTVRNAGNVEVNGVTVDLFAMELGLGNPWSIWDSKPIGSLTIPSIAPNDSQEASFDYFAPEEEAPLTVEEDSEISREMVVGAHIREVRGEITRENNYAQSCFIVLTSRKDDEGYSREATKFYVTNPYDRPSQIFLTVRQTNPNFRTFLDKSWMRLGPKETRTVVARFEHVPQTRQMRPAEEVNWVTINSFIRESCDPDGHFVPLTGINIKVLSAISTSIDLRIKQNKVLGKVRDYRGNLLASGKVVFWVTKGDRMKPVNTRFVVDVEKNGKENIETTLPKWWHSVKVYLIPPKGYSRCESSVIHNKEY